MDDKEFKSLLETARISLIETESEKIKKDLEEVISYFDQLDKIDCGNLQPAYHPIEIPGIMRDDVPEEFKEKKELLDNTKTHRLYVIGPEV